MAKWSIHRSDANASALYAYLEARGCSVARIGRPLDALVGLRGRSVVVEVKTATGKLRPSQKSFARGFCGAWAVIRTEGDCSLLVSCLEMGVPIDEHLHHIGEGVRRTAKRSRREGCTDSGNLNYPPG